MPNLPIPPSVKTKLPEWQVAVATRMGLTGTMARDVQREVMWWVYARVQAAQNVRGLYSGVGIGWTSSGYAELLPVEVPRPGRGRVTVLTHTSVVSPGTERARYLRLPNASMGLAMPGYSSAGVVVDVGPGVTELAPGQRVAVNGGRHHSIATARVSEVYPIDDGVPIEAAAVIRLAVIAGEGLRRGRLEPGERFAVLGAGAIGLLAQRLGASDGAEAAAVIARSRAKEQNALRGGAQAFLLAEDDRERIEGLEAAVVIEATGDPNAIAGAVAAAAPGGRVVLLGSPRGVARDFPLDAIRAKRLEVIGAHVDMQPKISAATGEDVGRRLGERFMRALGDGIEVADLVGERLDPREAGLFYRRLADDPTILGAHFDWTGLPEAERRGRGWLLRPPSIAGAGLDLERRPLKAPRSARRLVADSGLAEPFAGASGNLRIGILGCGDIAGDNAAGAAAAPNTRLVACYDPVERLARDIASRHDAAVMRSGEELVEHPDVDAVLISVPHHLHAPLALQAIGAGKHVIVEKPLANTLDAALEMTAAAERAGVVLSCAFAYRYDPKVMLARRLVQEGALGDIGGCFMRSLLDKTPAYWVGGYSGRSPSDWRTSREKAGGGILIMNLTHYIDMFRHVTGLEAEEVWSHGEATDDDLDIEDAISVAVRYEGGAVGSVLGASAVRGSLAEEFRLWGRDGHIAVEPDARVFTLRAIEGIRGGRWQSLGALAPRPQMRAMYLSRLATAIDRGEEPDVSATDAVAVQAFVEAAYRSSETGRGVRPAELVATSGATLEPVG